MNGPPLLAVFVLTLLSGCATRIDRARITDLSSPTSQRLACALRLDDVVDERTTPETGLLGRRAYTVPDAPAQVRQALDRVGWSTSVDAASVVVRIHKLYLGVQQSTRMGVVVLEVLRAGRPPFHARGQATALNWSASESGARDLLIRALDAARTEVTATLNRGCTDAVS